MKLLAPFSTCIDHLHTYILINFLESDVRMHSLSEGMKCNLSKQQ
jgi:hypothetical protein